MRQQVNLYLPEFKVKKDPLTALLMGQMLGAMLVICVLVSAYDLFTRWRLNSEIAEIREVLVAETSRTTDLDDLLAQRSQNSDLTTRLNRAEARLDSSRQIRNFLSETSLGNVNGFSEYFKDLSRASINGLSIAEFEISAGGRDVSLTGQVADTAMVPRYVDNMTQGQSPISEMHFSPTISRTDVSSQYFNFVLSTTND